MLPCPDPTWAAKEVQNSGERSQTNPSNQNRPYCEGEDILEASSSFSPLAVKQSGDSLFATELSLTQQQQIPQSNYAQKLNTTYKG